MPEEVSEEEYNKFIQKAKVISRQTNVQLPGEYFRYGIRECYKCKKEILVFTWPNAFEKNDKPRSDYVPRTIKRQFSKTADLEYWGNSCPYCGALQGNFFLYMEPDGPFFNLNYSDNFKEDKKNIIAVTKWNETVKF